MVFKPSAMSVDLKYEHTENPEYVISALFNNIDDKYITNPESNDIINNKEKSLEREIRYDVENMFTVKTSGLDLKGFAPYKRHGLTIHVLMKRTP